MLFLLRWVVCGVLLACTALAHAETRVALVVANAAYREAPLQNPTVDAELVRRALEQMGFEARVIKDADLEAFALALQDFYQDAKGADIALFYFAGHGFAINGPLGAQNYLMSTSADVTSQLDIVIRSGGVALDEIIASLSDAANVSLVFVDACRNDPRLSRGGRRGRGLARIPDVGAQSMFVGLSTRLGDLAEDGDAGEGSPFARAFARYMPTPGLRLDDAFRQVRAAVMSDTGGAQRPEARDDLASPLVVIGDQLAAVSVGSAEASPPDKATPSDEAAPTDNVATLGSSSHSNPSGTVSELTIGALPSPISIILVSSVVREGPSDRARSKGSIGGAVWLVRYEGDGWVRLAGDAGYVRLDDIQLQEVTRELAREAGFPRQVTVVSAAIYSGPSPSSQRLGTAGGHLTLVEYAGNGFYRLSGRQERYVALTPQQAGAN